MFKQRISKSTGQAFALLAAMLMLVACGSGAGGGAEGGAGSAGADGSGADGAIRVVTTIAQIAEPISVIGGGRVQVTSLMGPGVDPHLYQASQSDIRKLGSADIIFCNGLHLEANMLRAFEEIGKSRPVLAVGEAIAEDRLLTDETGAVDPHVWFDIDLWKEALGAAVEELKKLSPDDAEFFEANKRDYFAKMDELKEEAVRKMASVPEKRRVLVTAHDAFGYFGRMLGLEVVGLQGLSTEDEIGLSDIERTIGLLVERRVPAVFVESSINPKSIEAVIEGAKERGLNVRLGGELFSDAMGGAGTEEGTYLGMFRHNVDTIYEALTGEE
ncbi:ABC-type metal ion transport system, periplasmic component/surface adhesin [Thermobacillus composti KWC4]|uniref:ABC-type metal ion transport system, periplasmic component/surface adhesin n=1 Tax=Thermobacillus composti (strain DSM 18247 / JCM 13945 / KWC4) TaxID=717605 RepID=L0EH77_THECK|nr:zinc ABC transporter substrate-binding protein [Thermobacillus composti]AGA59046.1 ABC-type metal ion transport system, periplasmic component/surface adhesin [Thermobacillus composti KWC4]